MKTKHFLTLAAALLCCALPSCLKEGRNELLPGVAPTETGTLSINIDGILPGATKADPVAYTTTKDYEVAVNKLEVFIFNATGVLERYINGTQLTKSGIQLTVGSKTVYTVVNGQDLAGSVKSLSELEALVAPFQAYNSTVVSSGMIMTGKNTVEIVANTNATCDVTVRRLVYRVALEKVTSALPSQLGTVTVEGMLMVNGGADLRLSDIQTAGNTTIPPYNTLGKKSGGATVVSPETSDAPALMYSTINLSTTVDISTDPKFVYSYPSSCSTANYEQKFVVQTSVDGVRYYYPIKLSGIRSNQTVTINLVINNLGSTDPNKEVEKGSATVNVTVSGWDSGISKEYTI